MFGFCPLFTPTLLSRRAGSDVDATAAADRTRKPRRCHVSTGQNKKRRGERIAEGSGGHYLSSNFFLPSFKIDFFPDEKKTKPKRIGSINPNKKGMVLPFVPLSMEFEDVRYSIDMPAVSLNSRKTSISKTVKYLLLIFNRK